MATVEAVQAVSSRLDHVVSRLDEYAVQVQGQFDAQDKRAAAAKDEFQDLTDDGDTHEESEAEESCFSSLKS